jgi:DNA polymerase I
MPGTTTFTGGPGYKATRPDTSETLRAVLALPDARAGLDMHGITWIEIDDAEADEMIATLAAAAPGQKGADRLSGSGLLPAPARPELRAWRVSYPEHRDAPGSLLIGPGQVTVRYGITP